MLHRQKSGHVPSCRRQGFSLVELLTVIAVVAVMAAIVIPMLGNLTQAAAMQRNRNNAQNICSMAAAAEAGGMDFVVPGDKLETIKKLMAGVNSQTNALKGVRIKLGTIKLDEVQAAAALIELNGDALLYSGTAP